MKFVTKSSACALVLSALCMTGSASAGSDWEGGHRANRIVGIWSTEGNVGPCGGTPNQVVRNTLLFNANGTVVENPRIAPNGITPPNGGPVYQRTIGLGTWTYDRRTRRYFVHLRFDNYVANVYDGYSTVDREIVLDEGAMNATGPVTSSRFRVGVTDPIVVCGTGTSARL